jgi:meiosis-specific protein
MRNVTRALISSIAYMRNLFPDKCFKDIDIGGTAMKALQPVTEEARILTKWFEKGVCDAINKKYVGDVHLFLPFTTTCNSTLNYDSNFFCNAQLRTMIFSIYEGSPDFETADMLECYYFNFSYSETDGASITFQKKGSGKEYSVIKKRIRNATQTILRSIISLAQTMNPLPDDRYLAMKLLYHDDVTPDDYEPSYFRRAVEKDVYGWKGKTVSIKLGSMQTPFHEMKMRVRAKLETFGDDCEEDMHDLGYDIESERVETDIPYSTDAKGERHAIPDSQTVVNAAKSLTLDQDDSNTACPPLPPDDSTPDETTSPPIGAMLVAAQDGICPASERSSKAGEEDGDHDKEEEGRKGEENSSGDNEEDKKDDNDGFATKEERIKFELATIAVLQESEEEYISAPYLSKLATLSIAISRSFLKRMEAENVVGQHESRKRGRKVLRNDFTQERLEKLLRLHPSFVKSAESEECDAETVISKDDFEERDAKGEREEEEDRNVGVSEDPTMKTTSAIQKRRVQPPRVAEMEDAEDVDKMEQENLDYQTQGSILVSQKRMEENIRKDMKAKGEENERKRGRITLPHEIESQATQVDPFIKGSHVQNPIHQRVDGPFRDVLMHTSLAPTQKRRKTTA